jgi:hypothetical protein
VDWGRIRETRNAYKILVGKYLAKQFLGRRIWEDNIKTDGN